MKLIDFSTLNSRAVIRLVTGFCLFLLVFLVIGHILVHTQQGIKQVEQALEARLDSLKDSLAMVRRQVSLGPYLLQPTDTIQLPDTVVTLNDPHLRSQVQRELGFILDHRWAYVEAWQNLGRYDSLMRTYFARDGVEPRLGRMLIAENQLRPRGLSPKYAQGPCGITELTGRQLGLKITSFIDERRAPVKAFSAASRHLAASWRTFHSWALAAAAYNRGDGGVNERLYDQGFDTFFGTLLPDETQRYVYEWLALLLIDQQSERFMPGLREVAQLPQFRVTAKQFTLRRTTRLVELAEQAKLPPTTFWFYNMQFTGKRLPPGTYTVYLPVQ